MMWKSIILEAIVKKSKERLKREYAAAGYPRKIGTLPRVLGKLRKAGIKSGMEGKPIYHSQRKTNA
jgi:hypothetical protein